MAIEPTPVELEITFRHMDPSEGTRQYIVHRLSETARSLPNLRSAAVEVSLEETKSAEKRYVVQVTLAANGALLRAEEREADPLCAVDAVHDLLQRRIRDWKEHVYYGKRQEGAEYKQAVELDRIALLPEDISGLIVRVKGHELKPMFPEDAVEQMELLCHDFFFFLNAETN